MQTKLKEVNFLTELCKRWNDKADMVIDYNNNTLNFMENKPTNQSAQSQEQAIQEAKRILEKYFNPNIYDVKEALEMGRSILYTEQNAIKAMLEYSSSQLEAKDKEIEQMQGTIDMLGTEYEFATKQVSDLKSKLSQATAQSKSVNPPAQEVESLIDSLKLDIEESQNNGDSETSTSWGHQEGILISRKQARLIIQSLTSTPLQTNGREVEPEIGNDWYCEKCKKEVPNIEVTFSEFHDGCGGKCI